MRCSYPCHKVAYSALIILSVFIIPPAPSYAQMQMAAANSRASDIPLMVVRYNQRRVYYNKQLYNAASKALRIKPETHFSLVSFVPQYGDESEQENLRNASSQQIAEFAGHLKQMGVPQDRISVTREMVGDARYHEIYLYVD